MYRRQSFLIILLLLYATVSCVLAGNKSPLSPSFRYNIIKKYYLSSVNVSLDSFEASEIESFEQNGFKMYSEINFEGDRIIGLLGGLNSVRLYIAEIDKQNYKISHVTVLPCKEIIETPRSVKLSPKEKQYLLIKLIPCPNCKPHWVILDIDGQKVVLFSPSEITSATGFISRELILQNDIKHGMRNLLLVTTDNSYKELMTWSLEKGEYVSLNKESMK
jgi:hypothetical protein